MSLLENERVRDLLTRAGLDRLPPRALAGIVAATILVIGLALWRFWPAAPAPEIAFDEPAEAAVSDAGEQSAEGTSAADVGAVVHVAGAVLWPGVYSLPAGARVSDAMAAAGGALGSAACDAVNLARIVTDGERIYIPTAEEVAGSGVGAAGEPAWSGEPSGGGAGTGGAPGTVNINRATAAELETLPGVGPATAQKIVDDREANGPFATPEDLMRVPGIGPKKFEAMAEQVSVG